MVDLLRRNYPIILRAWKAPQELQKISIIKKILLHGGET